MNKDYENITIWFIIRMLCLCGTLGAAIHIIRDIVSSSDRLLLDIICCVAMLPVAIYFVVYDLIPMVCAAIKEERKNKEDIKYEK